MGLSYRLEDYAAYRAAVGAATYVDITRRSDPARRPTAWDHLREVLDAYGAPWVVQLWTKNVGGALALGAGLLERLRAEGTTLTAQVTITGLAGSAWEPLTPADTVSRLGDLARVLGGPEHITWRYDPIIPTVHEDERFARLAGEVAAQGVRRGVINFLAAPGHYRRVDRRLSDLLPGWGAGMPGYDADWTERTARALADRAAAEGISLGCCAESCRLAGQVTGLRRAACGDYGWFTALSGQYPPVAVRRGSRPGCGCLRYFDVGNYGGWASCHRCTYCYAG